MLESRLSMMSTQLLMRAYPLKTTLFAIAILINRGAVVLALEIQSKKSKASSSKRSEAGSQSLPNAGSGVLAGSAGSTSHPRTWSKAEAEQEYQHRVSHYLMDCSEENLRLSGRTESDLPVVMILELGLKDWRTHRSAEEAYVYAPESPRLELAAKLAERLGN